MVNGAETPLPDAWLGLTFAPDGKMVYAGGGSRGVVYEFSYAQGELKLVREMKAGDFMGDVALSPDGHLIYAADLFGNAIVVINPQSGRVIDRFKTGRRPYRILFHPDGRSYFVSSWADASVYQYNTVNGEEIGRIRLGSHPTDMVLSSYQPARRTKGRRSNAKYRLFVAAANTNEVFVVGIGDNKTMNLVGNHSRRARAALAARHDAQRARALGGSETLVCGLLGCRCGRVGGCLRRARRASKDFCRRALIRPRCASAAIAFGSPTRAATPWKRWAKPSGRSPIRRLWTSHPPNMSFMSSATPSRKPLMRAIAGIAPDFTVKLGRRPNFNIARSRQPSARRLSVDQRARGRTHAFANYGVFVRNGQGHRSRGQSFHQAGRLDLRRRPETVRIQRHDAAPDPRADRGRRSPGVAQERRRQEPLRGENGNRGGRLAAGRSPARSASHDSQRLS